MIIRESSTYRHAMEVTIDRAEAISIEETSDKLTIILDKETMRLSEYLVNGVPVEELRVNYLLPRNINQVLTPSKKGDKLVPLFDVSGKCPSYRCRAASEMLYAMIEANGKRTN